MMSLPEGKYVMRQTAISFRSGNLSLEAVLASPGDASAACPGVVLCHPHPLMGGTMDNAVVLAVSHSLLDYGISTLRFNFRGVGKSEGAYDEGEGEKDDAAAALQVMSKLPGINGKRLGLVGYSFGAVVSLAGLAQFGPIRAMALVSPPLRAFEGLKESKPGVPKLVVSGDRDQVVDSEALEGAVAANLGGAHLKIIPGANHVWAGLESSAAEEVAQFLATHLVG